MTEIQKLQIALSRYYPMWNYFDRRCVKFPSLDMRCQMAGLIVEIYNTIAMDLNLEIKAYDWGKVSYIEHLDSLYNGTVDLLGFTFERTKQRDELYDFSEALYDAKTRLAVRRQDTSMPSIFDFFKVFGWNLWLMFAASFLLFTTIGLIVRFVEWRFVLRNRLDTFELVWRMARLQLIQHERIEYKLISGNFSVLTFGFLQCAVLLGFVFYCNHPVQSYRLYNSYVIGVAIRDKNAYPFKSNELFRVLREKRYSFVTAYRGEWYFEMIESSTAYPFYELKQAMVNNPVQELGGKHEVLDAVNTANKIAVLQDDNYDSYLAEKLYCDLVYLESPFPPIDQRIMMRKNHPLLARINQSIINNRVKIYAIYRTYYKYRNTSNCDGVRHRAKPLNIDPYIGVMIVYSIGIIFALFAFGTESFLAVPRHLNNLVIRLRLTLTV
ncbi:hypothetical protein M3Y98_01013000 [Aphelenchoides besseyi]|nr:hypothetical protein M3Y98_01013000 [Aphelenchoides besseyi]